MDAQILAVEAVYETAMDDRRWIEGHDVFDTVPRLSLAHERSGGAPRLTGLLLDVTETVAKITYNASGASAPSTPRRLAPCAARARFRSGDRMMQGSQKFVPARA